jgi:hypothetical protein
MLGIILVFVAVIIAFFAFIIFVDPPRKSSASDNAFIGICSKNNYPNGRDIYDILDNNKTLEKKQ